MHNPNFCYCVNIGSDIGPPAVLYRYRYWWKNTISVADIVADPIIGTPLPITSTSTCVLCCLLVCGCGVSRAWAYGVVANGSTFITVCDGDQKILQAKRRGLQYHVYTLLSCFLFVCGKAFCVRLLFVFPQVVCYLIRHCYMYHQDVCCMHNLHCCVGGCSPVLLNRLNCTRRIWLYVCIYA